MAARDIIQAAAGAAGATEANYIEDVFSTYLYNGNQSTQQINNGVDLLTKGGLVWSKSRTNAYFNILTDTIRGVSNSLKSDATSAQSNISDISAFTSTGYTLGWIEGFENANNHNYASWTFRKQPKFFDVVTYTGNGIAGRQISHSLGATPGMVIIKRTDAVVDWMVLHKGTSPNPYGYLFLNTTAAATDLGTTYTPTSTYFIVGNGTTWNASGGTYVAYLFADSNSGGFGPAGTDSVVACGSFTTSGETTVNLGWEPQYVLIKKTDAAQDWYVFDNMRGMSVNNSNNYLLPNSSSAEASTTTSYYGVKPTATGFVAQSLFFGNGYNYIYLAIRRGPMKTPTDATKVFAPVASSAATGTALTTGFPVDTQIFNYRASDGLNSTIIDRLRGISSNSTEVYRTLSSSLTAAENTSSTGNADSNNWTNTSFGMPRYYGGGSSVFWNFRRAPGFFDVVCYTGTGSARTVAHNLGVVPELLITKPRSAINPWFGGSSVFNDWSKIIQLNSTGAAFSDTTLWNATAPTSSNFSLGTNPNTNQNGTTFIAYLFATCPGVSKVGSYTGNGTTKQIDCGFSSGARFVLIKRTNSTGSWYVWDTARGLVSGNDPYLLLNSTAAEVTNTDYIDPYSAGFEISSTAPAEINASGGTYIYLAIA